MQQHATLTAGLRPPVIKAFVLALMGSLCYHVATEALPAIRSPKIKTLTKPMPCPSPGAQLNMSCKVDPGYPDDFTLIYWLVNSTFVEMLRPVGRVTESEEITRGRFNGVVVQRNLMVSVVKDEDYNVSYTCVVMSPVGVDSRTVRLRQRRGGRKLTTKVRRQGEVLTDTWKMGG